MYLASAEAGGLVDEVVRRRCTGLARQTCIRGRAEGEGETGMKLHHNIQRNVESDSHVEFCEILNSLQHFKLQIHDSTRRARVE
jgi:hypothetical protein